MSLPIDSSHHHHRHVHSSGPSIPASIVPLKGKIQGDSSSSGGGGGVAYRADTQFVADPGVPRLNPNTASDADLFMLIGLSLAYDRRSRRRSDQRKDSQFQLQSGMVWRQEAVSTTQGGTQGAAKTGDKAKSDSTSDTTEGTTDSTESAPAETAETDDASKTATIYELRLQGGAMMRLQTTLLDASTEPVRKRFHHHLPSGLMDQLQAYIHAALATGILMIVPPALGLLGDPKLGFRVDNDITLNAATAVSYQNFAMQWANSGDIKNFVDKYVNSADAQNYAKQLYPNDPAAQQSYLRDLGNTLKASLPAAVINSALEITGNALGLAGYATQIRLQAELVRNENAILIDATQVASIARFVSVRNDGITESQISRIIKSTMIDSHGNPIHYLTHDDLLEALKKNSESSITNPLTANNVANDIAEQTVDLAIGDKRLRVPTFDSAAIDFEKFKSSLINALQEEFARSNQIIRAFTLEKQISDQVLSAENLKRYHNEQDVRDEIKSQLLEKVPGITRQQAEDIAAAVNIGGPQPSNPLNDRNHTGTFTPADFSLALRIGYQDNLKVSPNSLFGDYINFVSGTNGVAGENSPVALLNEEYYHGDERTRSYLNPTAEDAAKFQQLTLGDPAAAVRAWGIQENNKSKAVKTDIPL